MFPAVPSPHLRNFAARFFTSKLPHCISFCNESRNFASPRRKSPPTASGVRPSCTAAAAASAPRGPGILETAPATGRSRRQGTPWRHPSRTCMKSQKTAGRVAAVATGQQISGIIIARPPALGEPPARCRHHAEPPWPQKTRTSSAAELGAIWGVFFWRSVTRTQ